MAKCGDCVHYNRCAGNAGWCKKDTFRVAVIADKEACEDFKRGTSLMDTKTVTIALERHEEPKCGDCVHYNRCADNDGWCKKNAILVAVITDKEACEDFKRETSMPDKTSEVVTVSLPWYEALIATYAKLEAVRQLVRHMSKTYNKELDLLKAVLEEEECETT